jgi:threonine dehydrogenase-like Zn-dependent dehydrogenase
LLVLGLGPIGDMSCRVASYLEAERVIGIDLVPERLERSRGRGVEVLDLNDFDGDADIVAAVREMTGGRGPDAVIDAVGMEAHGSPAAQFAQKLTTLMPNALTERLMRRAGVDRLAALHLAIEIVRRGGTISVIGVYGGQTDPMPMMTLFDKQITIRMGQANVRRWSDDIVPILTDDDPLGVDQFATHRLPLCQAAAAYAMFQEKRDGAIKVLFRPGDG